jgi:hypothetical protein
MFVEMMQVDSEDSKNRTNDDRRILQVNRVTKMLMYFLHIRFIQFDEAMLQLPAGCAVYALRSAHLLFYAYKWYLFSYYAACFLFS